MDKKISEFKAVTATDNTTQIPLVQGLPLENCKITPRNFSSSVAEILLARPEFDFSIYAKKEDFDNIDNTSDLDKPISFATQTALNKKVDKVTGKGLSTNDYTTFEKNKLSAIPVGAKFTDTITSINGKTGVITKADIVALGIPAEGGGGDVTGLASIEYVNDRVKTTVPIGAKFTDTVTTVNGKTGEITKADIVALGVAELDAEGIILTAQLPSYVDDVLEFDALANFPTTGESGKIYVAIDTNLTYRWTGTTYVEISPSIAIGETSATAYRGDRGKIAYDHSQTAHAPSNAQKNSDITKAEIEAKLTGAITTHTHSAYVPTSRKVAGKALTGDITLAKGDVGLGNVNNTSDADKPVSTAQAAAIALKINASKFQVVAELPTSPTAGVFYFIKE